MYYIFNNNENLVSWCDFEPDTSDLASRNEFSIFFDGIVDNPANLVVGKYKSLYEPAEVMDDNQLTKDILTKRQKLLEETDWIVTRHTEQLLLNIKTSITTEELQQLLTYRQSLRDITSLEGFPRADLPDKPQFME